MKKLILTILIIHFSLVIANAQWVQMSNGMGTNITVWSLAVSGNNIFAGTVSYGVYLSTDNGATWTSTVMNNSDVYSLAVIENNIFAGISGKGVYLSTNNGVTWTQTALNNKIVLSLAVQGNNIFAGTDPEGVYLSTNSGVTWNQTDLNNRIIHSLAVKGNNIFAGADGVYLSTNNGSTWTQTGLNNYDVWSLAVNENNIFAGTENGVYLSTNNGTIWTQIGLSNIYVKSLAVNGNNIFAGTYNNGIYLYIYDGSTWIQKNQGFSLSPSVLSIIFTNNYILAGTYEQSVWRRSLSEIIGIQVISTIIPKGYDLSQNYPNPFNPTTKIKFDITGHTVGQTFLSVYDITGREIQTLVNEKLNPRTYEVTFDGSQLPSGVYFYQLSVGNDIIAFKKMILLK